VRAPRVSQPVGSEAPAPPVSPPSEQQPLALVVLVVLVPRARAIGVALVGPPGGCRG